MLIKHIIPCPKCGGNKKGCSFCNSTGKVELVEDEGLDCFDNISLAEAMKTVGNQLLLKEV